MALQISSLFSHSKVPLSRVRANFQGAGVKFKHILSPGSPQLVRKPATSVPGGRINGPPRAEKFSTTTPTQALWRVEPGNGFSATRGKTGRLGRVALGVAVGVSSVAVVQALHTGTLSAMARRVNLDSAQGDWKETKGEAVQPRPDRCSVNFCCSSAVPVGKNVCSHMTKTSVQLKSTVQQNKHVTRKTGTVLFTHTTHGINNLHSINNLIQHKIAGDSE